MQSRTLLYLAGACGALIVILLLAGSGGLNRSTRELLDVELREYPAASTQFERQQRELEMSLARDPQLFGGKRAAWEQRLTAAAQKLSDAGSELDQARDLSAGNDDKLRASIESKLSLVRQARSFAAAEASEIEAAIAKLERLKRERPQVVAAARKNHDSIQAVSFTEVEGLVRRAASDWPQKAADLEARLAGMRNVVTEAATVRAALDAEDARDDSQIDYARLADAADRLELGLGDLNAGLASIPSLVDQLYVSWDEVLSDMSIEEGADVRFFHLVRKMSVRIENSADGGGSALPQEENWVQVQKATYERHKDHLGMTLASKPAGFYDSEAKRDQVQPAGMGYIASPEQGQNRYGRWERRSDGSSFWSFYGRYKFMEAMFWGPSWRSMRADTWNDYDRTRRRGQTWYGRSASGGKTYGSSGTATRSKYSGSKYVKSEGFRSSKYVKSGGSYRGSRFETKSSRSSGSSRSSRSFGGSSRSRSFGGFSRSFGGK